MELENNLLDIAKGDLQTSKLILGPKNDEIRKYNSLLEDWLKELA